MAVIIMSILCNSGINHSLQRLNSDTAKFLLLPRKIPVITAVFTAVTETDKGRHSVIYSDLILKHKCIERHTYTASSPQKVSKMFLTISLKTVK